MSNKLFNFQWLVPQDGFRWIGHALDDEENKSQLNNYLSACGFEYKTYFPLIEFNGLFYDFAHTATTKEAIKAFADKYGALEDSRTAVFVKDDNDLKDIHSSYVLATARLNNRANDTNSIDQWIEESLLMNQVVNLWQLAQKNSNKLNVNIEWVNDKNLLFKKVYVYNPERLGKINLLVSSEADPKTTNNIKTSTGAYTSISISPELMSYLGNRKLQRPALYLIQYILNDKINQRINPELSFDDNGRKLNFSIVPKTLIGALWLQCAQAISGNKEYSTCKTCSSWFELAPHVKNKGKIYCSDACKSKAWRLKKRGKSS